jgi:glutaredoxin
METHTCPLCALARSTDDATGLAWSSQHESDGTITWICPTCTRAQLWLIEAGLAIATRNAPAPTVPQTRAA